MSSVIQKRCTAAVDNVLIAAMKANAAAVINSLPPSPDHGRSASEINSAIERIRERNAPLKARLSAAGLKKWLEGAR